jgi:GNAT superfamily N-acetyltransferase
MHHDATIGFERVQPVDVTHTQLRERATPEMQAAQSELFVATIGSNQVGLLSLDFQPLPQALELFEVFVVSEYRCQGVGSFLLEQAELVGRGRGYRLIRLRPHPLTPEQRPEYLVEWYRRRGYSWSASVPDLMSKSL